MNSKARLIAIAIGALALAIAIAVWHGLSADETPAVKQPAPPAQAAEPPAPPPAPEGRVA